MGTKSDRSSGTQHTPRGVNQGTVLVDPKTGNPINTIDGKLDTNASVSLGDVTVSTDPLTAATDAVRVEDNVTGAHVRVELDGSINANVKVDSSDGDNIAIVGTEDGLITGTKHVAKIGSDGKLETKDTAADASLASIDTKLSSQATAANQTSANTKLDTIHTDLVTVEGKQDTGNASLGSIDTKLSSQATAANQTTANASLASIDSKLTNPIPVTGPLTDSQLRATPVPVSATALPLPTGAAKESKQDVGNASLASIDSKLSTPMPVDVSAQTGDNVALGNTWKKMIDEASASTIYIGLASPGSLVSTTSWQIKRITIAGAITAIEFADGDLNFDNIWNNRASLTYN